MRLIQVLPALALFTACGSPSPASDGGLDLNDVSFLLPLPTSGHEHLLPAVGDDLGHGPLLPRALYDGLPPIVEGVDNADLWPQFRVVSARVDPCFPGSTPPAAPTCIKQIRLVAQPVFMGGADAGTQMTTQDGTIHLFYALSDDDFTQVHRALWDLKARAGVATDHAPLDVHPVLRAEGLDGAYMTAFRQNVLGHCGSASLTRVAFMAVQAQGSAWRFGAFDLQNGALVAAQIPRLQNLTVQGVQEFGSTEFRNGDLLPTVAGDDLDVLLSESAFRLTDQRTLDRALTSALKIEHPDRSSPKTIDCASCHVASRARHNAETELKLDTSSWPDAFSADARFDLQRVDAVGDDPHALRSFGYLGPKSALSQRTINESAVVAATLSRTHP